MNDNILHGDLAGGIVASPKIAQAIADGTFNIA